MENGGKHTHIYDLDTLTEVFLFVRFKKGQFNTTHIAL